MLESKTTLSMSKLKEPKKLKKKYVPIRYHELREGRIINVIRWILVLTDERYEELE